LKSENHKLLDSSAEVSKGYKVRGCIVGMVEEDILSDPRWKADPQNKFDAVAALRAS
jgi:hypothetical protein